MSLTPEQHLLEGAEILSKYLVPLGFKYQTVYVGKGSGGHFAQGQFVCGDRTIDLHFRWSLGLVSYKADSFVLSHEDYIDMVGKHGLNKYPNFSEDPSDAFRCLSFDMENFLNDFTENNASTFRQTSPDKIKTLEKEQKIKSDIDKKKYTGDQKIIDQAKVEFKKGNYLLVDKLKGQIQFPDLLTATEKKIFQLSDCKLPNISLI